MIRQSVAPVCAVLLSAVFISNPTARAEVVGGGVTGGTSGGAFSEVSPPAAAGPDAFQSPDLLVFEEVQNLTLTEPLPVSPTRVLGAGSVVSSHYVAFDPLDPASLIGFIDFDEPIIGILSGGAALDATAPLLGDPGVAYSVGPAVGVDEQDTVMIAPGMRTRLLVDFQAASPGDQLRVLTGVAVPEPAGLLLGVLALTGAGIRLHH